MMSKKYQYSERVGIITDDLVKGAAVVAAVSSLAPSTMLNWSNVKNEQVQQFDIPVFQVDLSKPANSNRLKRLQFTSANRKLSIFVVDKRDYKQVAQANALGAAFILKSPLDTGELINLITSICESLRAHQPLKNIKYMRHEKQMENACLSVADLLDSFSMLIRKGGKLPKEAIHKSSSQIINVLDDMDMNAWLAAVRSHSSYTYRHVMIVAGYVAAFANMYNLPYTDKERLIIGALVHDIGKVKISQKILDKPDPLTVDELEKMRRHTIEGAAILRKDNSLSREVIAIARSHHEYLDGSGYPDGLKGCELPDIIRVMTIIDTFSTLVDAPSHKQSLSAQGAYEVLIGMGEKLDQDIVRAFKPIALNDTLDDLVRRLNQIVA